MKRKKRKILFPILLLIFLILLGIFGYTFFINKSLSNDSQLSGIDKLTNINKDSAFLKAASPTDSSYEVIRMSEPLKGDAPYQFDYSAGKPIKRVYNGRRINIAITGLDGRLGSSNGHGDANHVLSILIDSGIVEITSIPRDTPADAGYPDSTGLNKLTVLRMAKGRNEYLKEVAKIAELDKIQYYVEFGFSQAMGLLELLGYKDAGSTLQVLRSRKALGGDDFQRCYNQGQFIRQMLLRHFDKLTGFMGNLLIRGGLAFVETNLDAATIDNIAAQLKAKNFAKNPDCFTIRVRPPVPINYKVYDFSNKEVVAKLENQVEYYHNNIDTDTTCKSVNPSILLWKVIADARKDSAKSPGAVIQKLKNYFEQRAWLQVKDKNERNLICKQLEALLINSYERKKQPAQAQRVRDIIQTENNALSNPLN